MVFMPELHYWLTHQLNCIYCVLIAVGTRKYNNTKFHI